MQLILSIDNSENLRENVEKILSLIEKSKEVSLSTLRGEGECPDGSLWSFHFEGN